MIKLSKVSDKSIFPTRGSEGAAGWDLYAAESAYLEPGERALIDTGIASEFSECVVGIIKPRSGIAFNNGIDVLAGVIDSDFRSTIKVLLINFGGNAFWVNEGDRIAQILFMPVIHDVVEHDGRVSETARGLGGFGSSGK